MSTVLERRRPSRLPPASAGAAGLWLGTAAVLGLFAAVVHPALAVPSHVDHVVVENPHPWTVAVEARAAGTGGWVLVTTVPRGDAVRVDEVLDQGDRWELRFRSAGHPAGSVVVDRTALEEAGWRVAVPDAVADRLREAGLPPSAR